ncbi:DNA-binding response regulator [Vibrio ishigakensis]|uniref:DNA-binding response regulator n=1 Tax=Vibrio ishigakensis TaxID=1481914 RepID=A0A0B8PPD4_9VIBR|nr:DNA-binding response regulator [Vibrio ishigakensis]
MDTKHIWIGLPLESLLQKDPHRIKSLVKDYGRDISVLTRTDVRTALFYLDDQVEDLFALATKICFNLDKELVVVTRDDYIKLESVTQTKNRLIKLDKTRCPSQLLLKHLTNIKEKAFKESPATSNRLTKIDSFIDTNISRDIREEEVANLANFSTTYFSKFFRKHKKISFQEYLSNKRVELSKQLLASQPSEKVSSIAFQVGYSDVSYFNRVFKKHTSLTPTEYRQNVVR